MNYYHIILGQSGYWEVWYDAQILQTFHTKLEAEEFVRNYFK